MSFSSDIKDELSRASNHGNECCNRAELTGYLITNCTITRENGDFILRMSTENASVIRRVYNTIKSLYGITPITNVEKARNFKENLYQLKILDKHDLENIFKDSFINIDVNMNIVIHSGEEILKNDCCIRSFLRGVFMGSGSMADPSTMYHLEMITNTCENARFVSGIINDLDIKSKIIKRKKTFVIYIKGAEQISDFLAVIGSNKGTIQFEETRVMKSVRNNVNRLNNFENANFDKTVDASIEQVEDIMLLKKYRAFEKMPKGLKDIANLRLEHKNETFEELGNLLEPKLSRSGVSHRFRRLKELANELRNK